MMWQNSTSIPDKALINRRELSQPKKGHLSNNLQLTLFNGEKLGLPTSVQHCTGAASLRCNKAGKIKGTQTGKEEVKLSLFAYHMTVYTESPEEPTKSSLVRVSLGRLQDTDLCTKIKHFYIQGMNNQKVNLLKMLLTLAPKIINT